jgi:dihydroorotate dehydrogenase
LAGVPTHPPSRHAMLARASKVVAGAAVAGTASALAASALGYEGEVALALARVDGHLRPALATVLPPDIFVAVYSASRSPVIGMLSSQSSASRLGGSVGGAQRGAPRHSAMGLSFRNDLGNAAGLDKDGSLLDFNYALGAGFAVVGTVLSEPHTGNLFDFLGGLWCGNPWTPLPQSGGALNSLGLPSKGVDCAVEHIAAFRERHGVPPQTPAAARGWRGGAAPVEQGGAGFPIGVSIMGHPAHASEPERKLRGVVHCVEKSLPVSDFIEINESCPNVHHGGGASGGGASGANAGLAARLSAVVTARDAHAKASGRRVPILVKLGELTDAKPTVRFLAGLGVDGLVLLNTQKDYAAFELPASDRQLLDHYTQRYAGGLSGAPILPRSVGQAAAAQQAVAELGLSKSFTVVHVGGLQSADDVARSRATGAELRQWYTGLMHGLASPSPETLYARVTRRATVPREEDR